MDIEQKLAELKTVRESAAFYRTQMRLIIDEAKSSPQYENAADGAENCDNMIAELEEEIKLKALEEYNGTKNKNPFAKVVIKIFKTFRVVDAEKARLWAFENLPAALKLDEAKIKTYAGSFGDVPGTEQGEEARAQIASEL